MRTEILGTAFTILFIIVFLLIAVGLFIEQPFGLAFPFFVIFGGVATGSGYKVFKYGKDRLK